MVLRSLVALMGSAARSGAARRYHLAPMAGSGQLPFSRVAEAFEQLEQTSSRKQLTTILADLLRQVDGDAIAEVTYLLQGRVAPLYEPVEFGLGERSIERAVAEAYGLEPTEVRQRYG